MIVGTGIDIAEVPRIAQALSRYGDRFLATLVDAVFFVAGHEGARHWLEPWRALARY